MIRKMPRIDAALLFLYTFSFFITGIPILDRGSRTSSLHWHFVVFIFLLMRLLFRGIGTQSMFRQIQIPSKKLMLFILYSVTLFLYQTFNYGFTNTIISLVYCFCAITVIYSLYREYSTEEMSDIMVRAYLVALVIIVIHASFQYAQIISFLRGGRAVHPKINTLVKGGVNVEASLCGIFSVLTIRKRYGMFVWYVCLILSALYSSRAGCAIDIMVIAWYMVFVKGFKAKTLLMIAPAIAVMSVVIVTSTAGSILIERFTAKNKSGDVNLSGREKIWEEAINLIMKHPLGVGCGNIMYAIERENNVVHRENNAHNIYIQFLAEEGVIFGAGYLVLSILWILMREIRRRFQNPFGVYLLIYFVQGLIQSTGADNWAALIAGVYFIYRWQERKGILQ